MSKDTAQITFSSEELANVAVEKYDGGILEIASKKEESGNSLVLHPNASNANCLEDRVGPLKKCQLRRGEGWVTVFSVTSKQQKKDRQS